MMPSKKLLVGVAAVVLVLFGVMSTVSPDERDDCYTTTGDPTLKYCVIEKEPLDLDVWNQQNETRTLSVQVSKNASVVYSDNITIEPHERHTLEDVIRTPGEYTIRGRLSNGQSISVPWTIEGRICVSCNRVIQITSDDDLVYERYPIQ